MSPTIRRLEALTIVTTAALSLLADPAFVRADRLSLPRWDNITGWSAPPEGRKHHTMVLDSEAEQVIMWSGESGSMLYDSDCVWVLDLCTLMWRRVPTSSSPAGTRPTPRHGHSAVCLPEQRRMIVMMGSTSAGGDATSQAAGAMNDVWELNLDTFQWTQPQVTLNDPLPPCPRWHAAATTFGQTASPADIYVFGGRSNYSESGSGGMPFAINDTWLLRQTNTGWQWNHAAGAYCSRLPEGPPVEGDNIPDRRYQHTLNSAPGCMTTPPGPEALYTLGGVYSLEDGTSKVYKGTVSGSTELWGERLFCDVTGGYLARAEHSAVFDPLGCRLILFGGFYIFLGWNESDPPVNWLSAMSIAPTCPASDLAVANAGPLARKGHAAIYDEARDRMIVFGGQLADGTLSNETWVLSFGENPSVGPVSDLTLESRTTQTATIGWTHPAGVSGPSPDICRWEVRSSNTPIVTGADFAAATPIAASITQTPSGGTWRLSATFTVASPPNFQYYAVRSHTGYPLSSGISNNLCFKLTPFMVCMEELRTEQEAVPATPRLSLSIPNPTVSSFECSISFPGSEAASLRVVDVAGRIVEQHEIAAASPGVRSQRIGASRSLAPGYYMVVLRQGASEVRKPVIVR